jgi:iron complex transport system permease protein
MTEISVENPKSSKQSDALRADPRKARIVAVGGVVAIIVLLLAIILPSGVFVEGFGSISLAKLVDQTVSNVKDAAATLVGSGAAGMYSAVMAQYCAAFVAGGALGVVGATFQGTFRNPLASPSTIGVISGCLFGATVYCLFLMPDMIGAGMVPMSQISQSFAELTPLEYVWAVYGRSICALIGGLAVAATALVVARVMGEGAMGNVVLIVVGQVFTLVLGTLASTVRYYFEASGDVVRADLMERAQASAFTMFYGFEDLAFFAIPVAVALVIILALRSRLNLLAFSDDLARTSGVDVDRLRFEIVLVSTVATGLVVGCCGPIAFVGFVCPHVARRIVGPNFRYLLPLSLFVGAIFLIVVVFIGNLIDIDMDQGMNLICTSIGCIVFLIVAFRGRGGTGAWR